MGANSRATGDHGHILHDYTLFVSYTIPAGTHMGANSRAPTGPQTMSPSTVAERGLPVTGLETLYRTLTDKLFRENQ